MALDPFPETKAIRLPDGRDFAWIEIGHPDGHPVMFFHGTPSSRLALRGEATRIQACDVRLIAVDRPGYGLSTFQPRRKLVDWPDDVARLADHLGLDRLAVIGQSGGGPHANVCARFLGDRITVAGVTGGYCPLEPGRRVEQAETMSRLSARAPWLARGIFAGVFFARDRWPEATKRAVQRVFPPADRPILTRPDVWTDLFGRSSPAAAKAAAQDMAILGADWGFRLEDIKVPVQVWHGTEDRNVPFSQGEYQARTIPDATLHRLLGEGHLFLHDHLEEVLASVTEPLTPTTS